MANRSARCPSREMRASGVAGEAKGGVVPGELHVAWNSEARRVSGFITAIHITDFDDKGHDYAR